MRTVANPNDRGGNTEVRPLKSGNHCYWEKNKATNIPASLSQFTPPSLITADSRGSTWDTSGSAAQQVARGCRSSTGISWAWNPIPPYFPMRVAPWAQEHLVTEETPTSRRNIGHYAMPCRDQRSQRRARKNIQNLRFSATYWKIKNLLSTCWREVPFFKNKEFIAINA